MLESTLLIKIVLAMVAVTAGIYDFRYRRVPNWLNVTGLLLGFGLNLAAFGGRGLLTATEGVLLAFAIYFPFYLLRGMGAGDVKLMAAIGALAGPHNWLVIFIYTALLGGISGVLLSLIKKRFKETCVNLQFVLLDMVRLRAPYRTNEQMDVRQSGGLRMPHAVLISAGSLISLAGIARF